MPVKVMKDGQIVPRMSGESSVGPTDRKVKIGFAKVHTAGNVLQDEEVAEDFLERAKAGEAPGVVYFENEEDSFRYLPEAGPEAPGPQNVQALQPSNDDVASPADAESQSPSDGDSTPEDPEPEFDPSDHNQAKVLEYLKGADAEEVERVKQVEAEGQGRQQIAAFEAPSSSSEFE